MSILKFKYDLSKDVRVHMETVYRFIYPKHGNENIEQFAGSHLNQDFVKELKKIDKQKAMKKLWYFLNEQYKNNKDIIDGINKLLEKMWNNREKESINRFEVFFEKPFIYKKIDIYLTTAKVCPYSIEEQNIMINWNTTVPGILQVIYHELMHFMFLKYSKDLLKEKGYTDKEIDCLKEAFSVFVNTEFKGLNIRRDTGYPDHQEIRKWLIKKRYRHNSYNELVFAAAKKVREITKTKQLL